MSGTTEARDQEVRLAELQAAFEVFTSATGTLEREYRALQEHARELRDRLEEKHLALMASLERQRELEVQALRHGRLAAMGEMAATLAHEVRNPLGAMALFARMLLDEVAGQAEATRLAGQVVRGIEDLDTVVNNILEYARMPAPDLGLVGVGGAIEDALAVARIASCVEIAVERELPAGLSWVLDRALLGQALVNLFRNAADAMAGGGMLRVAAAARGGTLEIAVADSGPGIPAERAESIFNPFFTTKARGTGLGLAVARAAIVAHGGTLELVPSREGACFVIRLPRASLIDSAAAAARAGTPGARRRETKEAIAAPSRDIARTGGREEPWIGC